MWAKSFIFLIDNQTNQEQSEDVWSSPNWSPHLEKIFVELLIEEMKYYPDVCVSDFNEEAWDDVRKEFNQRTGLNYDKMELKKRLAVLRKRYCIVKPFYNHGSFGRNYRWKMMDVDDLVWKEYVQVHIFFSPSLSLHTHTHTHILLHLILTVFQNFNL